MKYKIYISEVRSYSAEVASESEDEAKEIAEAISLELSPTDMRFGDRYIEVARIYA